MMYSEERTMIFIENTTIITQNETRQIIKDGAIVVEQDKIIEVGKNKDLKNKYKKKIEKGTVIDGKEKIAMPGLINTHTHLAMSLLRGYADDMPLEKWLFKKIFPREAKFNKDDIYWGSLLGGIEMVRSGTTYFVDFYFFADSIVRAVKKIGLRTNIGIPISDLPTPEFNNPEEAFKKIPDIIKKSQEIEKIKISLAPHMLQTTSLKTYKKAKELADKNNIILQTHLAETQEEVRHGLEKYKLTPAELLVKNKILDKNSLVAHGCWLNEKDIGLLAKNRVSISHCPASNMMLGSGIMPLTKLLNAGVNIALGTDGACSNNNLDMFEEMKISALLHKVSEKDPTSAPAQTVLDMATINGANALGEEKQLGSIEKDKKADIIILDFNQPHLTPCYNPVSHLVYSAKGGDVETVIINGKIIMKNRKIMTINENDILEKIKKVYK